jgi:formylglycine-generating enzyme required for sulfatase activity
LLALLVAGLQIGCTSRPESGTVSIDERTGLSWVHLRGGEFVMGSPEGRGLDLERPQVRVTLRDYRLTRTEVTVEQYGRCVRAGKCRLTPPSDQPVGGNCNLDRADRLDHPMNCVDWQMAVDYCAWAGGRLPSESEWEYAARGLGQDREYPWGDDPATCERSHLTTDEQGQNCEPKGTVPVCSRPAGDTPQGLCDMAGNVLEWVADWITMVGYGDLPLDGSPGQNKTWNYRGLRGCGIGSAAPCRVRGRVFHEPLFFYSGLGIRCAANGQAS